MDIHFNSYKIKYSKMDAFFYPIWTSKPIRTVNIFVSLDDLFHLLHKPLINNEFQVCGTGVTKQFISNVLNTLGHYRYWALKKGLDVKVFGVHTTNKRTFKNEWFVPQYRKKYLEQLDEMNGSFYYVNHVIRTSLPQLHVLSNYIPGVYVIDSKYLEPSILPLYLAEEVTRADWNILISRDPYDMQYALEPNWSVYVPKGEKSLHVKADGIWEYLNQKERIQLESIPAHLPAEWYSLCRAIVGDSYRNIPRMARIGWKTIFRYMETVWESSPGAGIVTLQTALLEEILKKKKLDLDVLTNHLRAVQLLSQRVTMLEIDRAMIKEQVIDIPDYETLGELNRTQFIRSPLNLQFLCYTKKEG